MTEINVQTAVPAAGSVAGTIETELDALANDHGLYVCDGRFAPRVDLPRGAEWRALYSRDVRPDYRYAFVVWWSNQAPSLRETTAWVMLNPATGDTDGKPRPILTGCRHRSEPWGYDGLIVLNAFAYRDRDPRVLKAVGEARAVGPANDIVLSRVTSRCGRTVAAWGDGGAGWRRSETVRRILHRPLCLPKTGRTLSLKGQPFYPKGIPLITEPVELPVLAQLAAGAGRAGRCPGPYLAIVISWRRLFCATGPSLPTIPLRRTQSQWPAPRGPASSGVPVDLVTDGLDDRCVLQTSARMVPRRLAAVTRSRRGMTRRATRRSAITTRPIAYILPRPSSAIRRSSPASESWAQQFSTYATAGGRPAPSDLQPGTSPTRQPASRLRGVVLITGGESGPPRRRLRREASA